MAAGDKEKGCVQWGWRGVGGVGAAAQRLLKKPKAFQGCRGANGNGKSGVETRLPASSIICKALSGWGLDGECVCGEWGWWRGDCTAEMGGLLISTMQYHAAGGSKARFGGNENGLSRRLMAHKDRAFRWDGRLNLDGGD